LYIFSKEARRSPAKVWTSWPAGKASCEGYLLAAMFALTVLPRSMGHSMTVW
jgi:hypothetical protein